MKQTELWERDFEKEYDKRFRSDWSRQRRRIYGRFLMGIRRTAYLGGELRFMTLTSSPEGGKRNLTNDYRRLVQYLRKRFKNFEYCRIKTNEGHGVIHLLYRGCYIPQFCLSSLWSYLHLSPIVWIVKCYSLNRGLVRYLVRNYLLKHSRIRLGYSRCWIFSGFAKKFVSLIREFGFSSGKRRFDALLRQKAYIDKEPFRVQGGIDKWLK